MTTPPTETKTPRTDEQEAKYRAEWLHRNKAPNDWIVLTNDEIQIIKRELADANRRCAELEHRNEINMSQIRVMAAEAKQFRERLTAADMSQFLTAGQCNEARREVIARIIARHATPSANEQERDGADHHRKIMAGAITDAIQYLVKCRGDDALTALGMLTAPEVAAAISAQQEKTQEPKSP